MASNWQIGDKIENRWEIHKILRGGMGIVYVVYDHESRVALACAEEARLLGHPQAENLIAACRTMLGQA